MTPLFFGSGSKRIFGIYEPSRLGSRLPRAAVLCYPWGQEYIRAHRSMRRLATMLAATGRDTLRFDYFGTGDSAGDMVEADLAGWENDIGAAIDEVKDTSGASRVTLLGLRLGGSLAARVAGRRPRDIEALVLWDPVVSGAEYLQELHSLKARVSSTPPATRKCESGCGYEILGFPLTAAMAAEIEALDLLPIVAGLSPRTLTIVTSPSSQRDDFASALKQRLGDFSVIEHWPGPPAWREDRDTGAGRHSRKVAAEGDPMVSLIAKVREQAVSFGKKTALVGILTEAAPTTQVKDAPAIVLLNAGIVHRVGPNRMYVMLARTLSAAGYMSLRFDLSGIGDSPNRADACPPLESAMSDIREAVDWLAANKHIGKVILLGLCSGADHSVLYASSDRRVVGIVLLDPTIPRTKRFHVNELRRKLSSLVSKNPAEALGSIKSLFKRTLHLQQDNGTNGDEQIEPRLDDDGLRDLFENHYRQCVFSDVKILAIFTGGMPGQHNYREQIIDAFPGVAFGEHLTLEMASNSDHAFTSEINRKLMKESVLRWLQSTPFSAKVT